MKKNWFRRLFDACLHKTPRFIEVDKGRKQVEVEAAIRRLLLLQYGKKIQKTAQGFDSRGSLESVKVLGQREQRYLEFKVHLHYRCMELGSGTLKTERYLEEVDSCFVRNSTFYERSDGGITISCQTGVYEIIPNSSYEWDI